MLANLPLAIWRSVNSLYSMGLIVERLAKPHLFSLFIRDLLSTGVSRIVLDPDTLAGIPEVMSRFQLDFDDAYQYAAAEAHDLTIISFDSDFDRTERGRMTPAALTKGTADAQ